MTFVSHQSFMFEVSILSWISMGLFGSSGIRGLVGEAITPELCLKIGKAVGSEYEDIVLGKDTRTSGDMVVHSLIAGLCSTGARVRYGGIMPTPTLARAAKGCLAGLMVTASHNPPEYNGVKMWNPDGSAFGDTQIEVMEDRIIERIPKGNDWDSIGTLYPLDGAIEEHKEAILKTLDAASACIAGSPPPSVKPPPELR